MCFPIFFPKEKPRKQFFIFRRSPTFINKELVVGDLSSPLKRLCKNRKRTYKIQLNICGNKMPTRCNRGFYCRSYCLLNMFRAPLFPSSGAQEYYTVVAACGISCCGFQVAGLVWS